MLRGIIMTKTFVAAIVLVSLVPPGVASYVSMPTVRAVVATPLARAPVPEPPCSLNGELRGGSCVCDSGWTGPKCGQLALLAAPQLSAQVTSAAATSSDNSQANSTWGISVIGPVAGVYHGYMTEIANECLLGSYGVASQIVHMTATEPLGPWRRVGVALAGFAHNPQALITPNGSIILFHIGAELPNGCLANCTGTPGHAVQPQPPGCPSLNHGLSVAVADSPDGPFRRFPYILESPSQPGGPTSATNPSALLLDANGTLLLTFRRAKSSFVSVYRGHCVSPQGPWEPLPPAPLHATDAGSPSTFEEDPFFFRTARGYHMLTHRAVGEMKRGMAETRDGPSESTTRRLAKMPAPPPLGPWLCGGGHIFSENLNDWFFGENVYGGSPAASAQCNITLEPSIHIALTSRQRATVFEDRPSGRRFLYTGASVNQSEYIHSFTLVQEISTSG